MFYVSLSYVYKRAGVKQLVSVSTYVYLCIHVCVCVCTKKKKNCELRDGRDGLLLDSLQCWQMTQCSSFSILNTPTKYYGVSSAF